MPFVFALVGAFLGFVLGTGLTVWWYEKADEQEWKARGQSR